jgi:hypothetical protein
MAGIRVKAGAIRSSQKKKKKKAAETPLRALIAEYMRCHPLARRVR